MDEIYNIRESDCDMEKAEKLFGHMSLEELEKLMDPHQYTGRCAEQVERYVEQLKPILEKASKSDEELDI